MLGIFRNPFDEPLTQQQVTGWFLYIILVSVSVWATGESLSRSFDMLKLITYVIGFAACAITASMLTLMNDAIAERIIPKLIVAIFTFLFVWMVSLLTNTHNFYLVGTLDEIRKKELGLSRNEIDLLSRNSTTVLDRAKEEYRLKVSQMITNVEKEITDEGKPGLGKRANELIRQLEEILNTSIARMKAQNSSTTAVQNLANRQSALIYQLLETKLQGFDDPRSSVLEYFEGTEDENIIQELDDAIENYELKSDEQIKKVLRKAYNYYNGAFKHITEQFNFPLITYGGQTSMVGLSQEVESIQLEHIANSIAYVRKNKAYNQPKFLLALAIALAIDLGAFAIFFYMVLPKKREW